MLVMVDFNRDQRILLICAFFRGHWIKRCLSNEGERMGAFIIVSVFADRRFEQFNQIGQLSQSNPVLHPHLFQFLLRN